jgi:hypothetical protein
MSYTLGIDPSSKREKTAWALVDDRGPLADVSGNGKDYLDCCEAFGPPAAVIIEWAEAGAGAYTPCRSRVADLMRLAVEQQRILDLYRGVCPVYCVPRRVILKQAKESVANMPGMKKRKDETEDQWVSRYLMVRGYARTIEKRKATLEIVTSHLSWTGTALTTPDRRDALMAALWGLTRNDPRNQEYLQGAK